MRNFIIPVFLITLFFSCDTAPSPYELDVKEYRQSHLDELVNHERAPIKTSDLNHVRFFDTDDAYKVEATVIKHINPDTFDMATYSGMKKPYYTYATLNFKIEDTPLALEIYKSIRLSTIPEYVDHIFLPFKDFTNGEESYGGGRYIDLLQGEIKEDKLEIDFNKCYNPWCAYSDGFNCPIPPKANHLELAITAGEKMFTGEKGK